jgi:NurA-like 5'-3' nuclease
MIDNSPFSDTAQNQFVVSYELLSLLKWLVEHDAHKLKKIISKALTSGLKKEIRTMDKLSKEDTEDIHHSIVEFLGLLEVLLHECITEDLAKQAVEKQLIPAIDHIDSTLCDDATVQSSVQKATVKSENNPELNPKELLFEELLKQWKPAKKTVAN